MPLVRYAEACEARRILLERAVARVVEVCGATADVREAFVFGSFASRSIGPRSDLDVLVVRETDLGIVDRVADVKFAARGEVPIDFVVVTPSEYATTFRASSFGRHVMASARRIYAA